MHTIKFAAPLVAATLAVETAVTDHEHGKQPHVDLVEHFDPRAIGVAAFEWQSTAAPGEIVSMADIWSTGVQTLPGGEGFVLSPVFSMNRDR